VTTPSIPAKVPELRRRSRGPAIALIVIGVIAWLFLLFIAGIHALFVINYASARPGPAVGFLAIALVILTFVSFALEFVAGVLGIILGIFAFRRHPYRAPVRTVIGLALIGSSIFGAFFILTSSALPAGYIAG
jgi:hypothetical protein